MQRDDLTLRIDGADIQGWQQIRITRGVERVPSTFEIVTTEHFPGDQDAVTVLPGASCKVLLGDDVVITGYVDAFAPMISPQGHQVHVLGRGMCCDLVDCSAEWPGGQINGTSALDVAQKISAPYGISVALAPGIDPGPVIPHFNLLLGETAWEVIERVCRYTALLAYELPDGSLLLNQIGKQAHASGFAQGKNVQEASIQYRNDMRYSRYVAFLQSVESLTDLAPGGIDPNQLSVVQDTTIKRHRQLDIVAEAAAGGQAVAEARANWECARRYGRSYLCHVTVDSWRDAAGKLWQPNMLAPIDLPLLKTAGVQWVISEVTYVLDKQGTTAELVLMPPSAFEPQPVLLQPSWLMQITNTDPSALSPGGFLSMGQLTNQAVGKTR